MNTDRLEEIAQRAINDHTNLHLFVEAALSGLHGATFAEQAVEDEPKVARVLGRPNRYPTPEEFAEAREKAKVLQAFATEQRSSGFPYLFALATVRLWSILEVFVDDIVVESLRDPRSPADDTLLSRLQGPLIPFLHASTDERAELLAATVKDQVKARLKPGVGRFEALLAPLDLGGAVPAPVRRAMLELSQVRNVLVHHDGIVDRHFHEMCPWAPQSLGELISVTPRRFHTYGLAADWYFIEVRVRIVRRVGNEPPDEALELQASQAKHLQELLEDAPDDK